MTSFPKIHHQEQSSSTVMRCACLLALALLGVVATSSTSTTSAESAALTAATSSDNSAGADDVVAVRHILHFSDVHLNISESLDAGDSAKIPVAYGDDAPVRLLVSALDYAKQLLPDPDFFLYTGDHAVHGELSDSYLAEAVEENVETMAKYYSVNDTTLDITAVIGNADTSPDYTMNVTDPGTEENPAIALILQSWESTMSKSNLDWFKRRGYLAYALDDNLIVITLNTLPYSPNHLPDTSALPDPFEQFQWLNASLAELKSSGKLAYIVGHIPPIIDSYSGSPMWNETYVKTYKSIVGQYADIIKAQLFGHVHSIEFRLPLSGSQIALFKQNGVTVDEEDYEDMSELVPLFMTAAISPIFLNNPAFMIWDFDAITYDLLDFTVYGSNISSENQAMDWNLLFQASTEYGTSSLNTSEITSFVERAAGNAELLEQYYYNSKAQSRLQPSCVDAACQAEWLCSLYWWSTTTDYEACVVSTKAAKSKGSSAIQVLVSSSAGSLLVASVATIFGGMAATAVFVLVASRICRRGGDQEAAKLLQRQRVHFAAIV